MKQATKFLVVAAVAVSICSLVSTALAEMGHFGSGGSHNSYRGGGYSGGYHGGGYNGGYHGGGYYGGYHGGYRWGYYGGGWGWFPWNFNFVYAPSPYYYGGYYYSPPTTYYAPSVVYSSPPAVAYNSPPPAPEAESSQQPVVDRPLSPTAVDRDPPSPPMAQMPPQTQRNIQGQSISVADVMALAKAGLSDEVILSHIRNSQTVYHLTTAEIIDLKNTGVSEKVIDFMINTASAHS